jgi:O-antigen/teichoic acid export membrane protein
VGEFGRNVMVVLGGAATAHAITLASSPVLSRLYDPEDFGIYGTFLAVSQLLVVVGCGRYDMAVNLPATDEEGHHVGRLCLLIAVAVGALLAPVVAALGILLPRAPVMADLGNWMYFVPLFVTLNGLSMAAGAICNRHKLFGLQARNGILRSAVTAGCSIGLGYTELRAAGLMIGLVAGQALATASLVWLTLRRTGMPLRGSTRADLAAAARRYADFPRFLVPSGLVEAGSSQLPVLILGHFYGIQVVGLFSFANRTVQAPLALLGKSFGDVFRQSAAEAYARDGRCDALFASTSRKLTILALPLSLGLLTLSPWAFGWIFGAPWIEAGVYTQLLALMIAVRFVSSPLSVMFYIAERQRTDFLIQALLFAAVLTLLGLSGWLTLSARLTILVYGLIYLTKYLVEYNLSRSFSRGLRATPP